MGLSFNNEWLKVVQAWNFLFLLYWMPYTVKSLVGVAFSDNIFRFSANLRKKFVFAATSM